MANLDKFESWTEQLDRDIAALRDLPDPQFARSDALAVLESGYAELRAVNDEVQDQARLLEEIADESAQVRHRYDALSRLLPDGVLETDLAGVIRDANPAAARLLNVRADYLPEKPLIVFVADDERHVVTEALKRATTAPLQDLELHFQPRNGSPLAARVSIGRVAQVNDKGMRFLWVIRPLDPVVQSSEARDLAQSLADRTTGLQALSQRVVRLQEMEGHRLARELRERFGQALTAVRANLEALGRSLPDVRKAPIHNETIRLLDGTLRRLREMYFELRPPTIKGMGLAPTIRQLVSRALENETVKAFVETDSLPPLAPTVEAACVWLVREALHNTLRHAEATELHVALRWEGRNLLVEVRDNGRGFDVTPTRAAAERAGSFGLLGIEQRILSLGGTLVLKSAPEEGTEIRATIPF